MEVLNVLEKKVTSLIELIKSLKADKIALEEENCLLRSKLENLENTMLVQEKREKDWNQEIELTKMAVDDLIKSIDILVEQEQRS